MESRDLSELVRFEDDEPTRTTVFETERLWTQLLCLGRNQSLGPVADPAADAVVTVVAGEVVFLVAGKRKRLGQWGAVVVPARAELSIANASADPAVLLIVAAPPPAPQPG